MKYCIFNFRYLRMKRILFFTFLIFLGHNGFAQKDSLQLGDRYAEDQIYASISYAQFFNQPTEISRSGFSYSFSGGFIKDIILNKNGSFSLALGVGYGLDFFNHELKVEEINNLTFFNTASNLNSNVFKAHNLEFPIEIRWRTSNAKSYDFWRIYGGVKFLYNLSNEFQFNENSTDVTYKDVSSYNSFQYGLSISAGYDAFNVNFYYSLTPLFSNGTLNGEDINTSVLKFGLIFFIL